MTLHTSVHSADVCSLVQQWRKQSVKLSDRRLLIRFALESDSMQYENAFTFHFIHVLATAILVVKEKVYFSPSTWRQWHIFKLTKCYKKNPKKLHEIIGTFLQKWPPDLFFIYFVSFLKDSTIFTTNLFEKMSIQSEGFEPTTFKTWVSSP